MSSVKMLNIRGQEFPVRISYYALTQTSNELEAQGKKAISMEDLGGSDISIMEPLLYYGLIAGMKFVDPVRPVSEMPFARDEMPFILDECFTEFVKRFAEFLPQAQQAGGGADQPGKKPRPGKNVNP